MPLMVSQEAERRALEPVLRRIERDSYRVSPVYRKVMTAFSEGLTDPEIKMSGFWEKAGVAAHNSSELAKDLKTKPQKYVRERRMELAALLLLDDSLSKVMMTQISEAAGYSDYKRFGVHFREWSKQTPGEFRANPSREIYERLQRLREGDEPAAARPEDPKRRAFLDEVRTGVVRSVAEERLTQGRLAAISGRVEEALEVLPPVLEVTAERELGDLEGQANAFLGYVFHLRAAERVEMGQVDDAYDDAVAATGHYLGAAPLPRRIEAYRRRLAVTSDPRQPLAGSLCRRCRSRLLGPAGREMRRHLDRALAPVPRNLGWFRDACDDCYYVVWDAIGKARLGMIDDAWKAVWLDHVAEPFDAGAPASRGLFIALLHASEKMTFGDQRPRAEICLRAVETAVRLKDARLEALGRLHYGNALRAMGEHQAAQDELLKAERVCEGVPWLRAFWCFVVGTLKTQQGDYESALESLQAAVDGYKSLDPHMAGMVRMQEGDLHRFHHRYVEAIEALGSCEPLLDGRRAPLMIRAVLPLNTAAANNGLGEWDCAAGALARCAYDRPEHRGLWAAELHNKACQELGRGRPRESVPLFVEAKALYALLNRWLEVGVLEIYCVEAYVAAEERFRAIESCAEAVDIFRRAGCDGKTQEALAQLSQLLEPVKVDLAAVIACVRNLARRHGGCLPVP